MKVYVVTSYTANVFVVFTSLNQAESCMKTSKMRIKYYWRLFIDGYYIDLYDNKKSAVLDSKTFKKTRKKYIECECQEVNSFGDVLRSGVGSDRKSAKADMLLSI